MTRILVLRAREDALRTAEKLRLMGFTPVVSSVLEIAATGAPIPPGEYDAVLASSAKGIECADESAESYKSLPLHVVGARTAKAAEARGWGVDIVAGNVEGVLPLLLACHPQPAHFLYLAGCDRQPALEAGLRSGGHEVMAVDVYAAHAAETLSGAARAALQSGEIDMALHYSRRSAEIFLRLIEKAGLTERLGAVAHIALSDDVATPLRATGLQVAVAIEPDEAHLLDCAAAVGQGPPYPIRQS